MAELDEHVVAGGEVGGCSPLPELLVVEGFGATASSGQVSDGGDAVVEEGLEEHGPASEGEFGGVKGVVGGGGVTDDDNVDSIVGSCGQSHEQQQPYQAWC
ncbi:hypothetical protein GOP47_0022178 [Adiantum capillus-veneris]|uniref:Uncharacterized protein n=1 Tax=Adiantum capillus-veneris TaxID=13818 RepID=A0A9D4UAV4_ADICA|nr:hypothetical protein GOP47_0022178 [Adiantum capillus-veneris]